jgi:hypothetical protein
MRILYIAPSDTFYDPQSTGLHIWMSVSENTLPQSLSCLHNVIETFDIDDIDTPY